MVWSRIWRCSVYHGTSSAPLFGWLSYPSNCMVCVFWYPAAPNPHTQHPAPMVQIRCSVRIWWLSKWPVVCYAPPWWCRTIRLSIRSDYELKTMESSTSHPSTFSIWVSINRPFTSILKNIPIGPAHVRRADPPSVSSWRPQITVSISSLPAPGVISGRKSVPVFVKKWIQTWRWMINENKTVLLLAADVTPWNFKYWFILLMIRSIFKEMNWMPKLPVLINLKIDGLSPNNCG